MTTQKARKSTAFFWIIQEKNAEIQKKVQESAEILHFWRGGRLRGRGKLD